MIDTVPTSPPRKVHLLATTPRSLLVSWEPPPAEEHNGELTSYTVTVEDDNEVLVEEERTDQLEAIIGGLHPFQVYYVRVAASTEVGVGPYTIAFLIEMPEAGMLVCMYVCNFVCMYVCMRVCTYVHTCV